VVGVGGQGVIMISKAVARLCQENGLEVKQSEVHGQAIGDLRAAFFHLSVLVEVMWRPVSGRTHAVLEIEKINCKTKENKT
jgi:indolepyruvate ferredoxin oxidoreductase beta subunit